MLTPAELALVVDCTRVNPCASVKANIRQRLAEGVDWSALLQFAVPHGVLPLLANAVDVYAADLVPNDLLQTLQRVLIRAETRNRLQWHALAEAMQALEADGVRVLAYKGPALTAVAYSDFRLRESHDLDLWAAPAQTARAEKVLLSLDYRTAVYEAAQPRVSTGKAVQHTEFLSANGEVVIDLLDLELRPQFFFRPDFDAIWERRQPVTAFGTTLATPGPEDLWLALGVHGSKHIWRRLNWISDLAALLAVAPPLDWAGMVRRSRDWRCYRRLLTTCALLEQLYAVSPAPAVAKELVIFNAPHRFATELSNRMIRFNEVRTLKKDVNNLSHHLRQTDRPMDRLGLMSSELITRTRRFPSTVRKRLGVTRRRITVGAWSVTLPLPTLTLKVELDAEQSNP